MISRTKRHINRLTQRRRDAGLTQSQLANLIGISFSCYAQIEAESLFPFTYAQGWREVAKKIAAYYRVTPQNLFFDFPPPPAPQFSDDDSPVPEPQRSDDSLVRQLQPDQALELLRLARLKRQSYQHVLSRRPRSREVWEQYRNGKDMDSICRQFGFSRQRANQIINQVEELVAENFRKRCISEEAKETTRKYPMCLPKNYPGRILRRATKPRRGRPPKNQPRAAEVKLPKRERTPVELQHDRDAAQRRVYQKLLAKRQAKIRASTERALRERREALEYETATRNRTTL